MEQDVRLVKGRIFDIQKFSIHDGPGIRTIVFLKGCPLRCRWCCNPEGQNYAIETMRMAGKAKTVGEDITVGAVMDIVLQDRPYYRRSGGGLTLSGGEAFAQPEFAKALLEAGKQEGIHTAVETTASVPWEHLEAALPWLDLVLMDIKHMDGEKHRRFTGRDNALILENARRLAGAARELIIRVPVVPGFNDTPEEIEAIADYAAGLPGVKRLHLLPYHRLGQDKYEGLGREYSLKQVMPPPDGEMERLLSVAAKTGLYVQIGG